MKLPKNITLPDLNVYLTELGKIFRKKNGKSMPAEIIIVGGASILINYGFRNTTYDVDAIIIASSAMRDAIAEVGDKHGLPNGWLNDDFKRTTSFSDKLRKVSKHYRTVSNIVDIRTVSSEYLIAMKLKSSREYKYDLSDIVGILHDEQTNGNEISFERVESAVIQLYGGWNNMPANSYNRIKAIMTHPEKYEKIYQSIRENELAAHNVAVKHWDNDDVDKANTYIDANLNAVISDKIWVNPHHRKGKPVRGHWRKKRSK